MPVEEIVSEIRKQEGIINEAQKVKERLYQKLLTCGSEEYDLVSVKEASRILDCSLGLIYKRINSGELRTVKIGSAIRVYKSELVKA